MRACPEPIEGNLAIADVDGDAIVETHGGSTAFSNVSGSVTSKEA